MQRQELRDRRNTLVGVITTRPDGQQEGRDARNNLRGRYNPRTNETRDDRNNLGARAICWRR